MEGARPGGERHGEEPEPEIDPAEVGSSPGARVVVADADRVPGRHRHDGQEEAKPYPRGARRHP